MTLSDQRKQKLIDFLAAARMLDETIELWINPTDFSFIMVGFTQGIINPQYLQDSNFKFFAQLVNLKFTTRDEAEQLLNQWLNEIS